MHGNKPKYAIKSKTVSSLCGKSQEILRICGYVDMESAKTGFSLTQLSYTSTICPCDPISERSPSAQRRSWVCLGIRLL